jgi:hypothetical protein
MSAHHLPFPSRETSNAPCRRHGFYIPAVEVQLYMLLGWTVIDDCAGCDEVLMAPPAERHEQAA